MIKTSIIFMLVIFFSEVHTQTGVWTQTSGTPEGGGVTAMIVRNSNGHIFAATGSFNWPNGDMGGIRRTTDEGTTWENLWDVYTARTIIDGNDGSLYASVWPYPQNEGLYRSTDNGNTWGSPLVTAPSGDNIFSIALNPEAPTQTIFAGTRNGILRSTNNGASFSPTNNGIPANSWVRDVEVDSSSGIVAAATNNGLFISTDNGDVWQQASGVASGDTVVKLLFDHNPLADGSGSGLLSGTSNGKLYVSDDEQLYLNCALVYIFFNGSELADIARIFLEALNSGRHIITAYPKGSSGSGVSSSSDGGSTWMEENQGLPNNPRTSSMLVLTPPGNFNSINLTEITLFVGMYENTNGGAKIYKRTDNITEAGNEISVFPGNFYLSQNFPNPFNPSTKIRFTIADFGFTILKIYDVLGNEVATLINEEKPAGKYEVEFDGKNLPSGIYFYQLSVRILSGKSKDFIETRKLVLLK